VKIDFDKDDVVKVVKTEDGKSVKIVGETEDNSVNLPKSVLPTFFVNAAVTEADEEWDDEEYIDDEDEDEDEDEDFDESLEDLDVKSLVKEILENEDVPIRDIIHSFRELKKAAN
jgi:hypothetical protein